MSQKGNGTTATSTHTIGSSDFQFGTQIAVLRRVGTSWDSIMGNHTAGGACQAGIMFDSLDRFCWFDAVSLKSSTGLIVDNTMGWVLVAAGKATGTVASKLHIYRFDTDVWQHADSTVGTSPNSLTTAGGTIRLGNINADDLTPDECVVYAQRANTTPLTDGELEDLVDDFTLANWQSYGMTFLVDERDAFATDHDGTSTQSSIVGFTDDPDDPPGWASWTGAAPTTSRTVRRRRPPRGLTIR